MAWRDAVSEALKSHPDLVSAREKLNQSKADEAIAQSGLLPQVSASAGAQRSKSTSSTTHASTRTDSYSYGVNGSQLLFDSFKTYFDVQQAAQNVESSRFNYDIVSSDVRLRLRTAFVDLLKAQELLHIAQDIADRRKQSRDMVRLRYDAGSENRGALLTAEANLAQALFEISQAKRGIELAQRRLCRELGRSKRDPIAASGDFSVTVPETGEPDFERLAETTPSLRQLVSEREASRWGVKSSVSAFFPTISADGSAGRSWPEWPPRGNEWTLGISVSVPIFEGGNLAAQMSKAEAEYHQAQADEKSGRDGAALTLQDNWTQFQDAVAELDVQKKFLEAAQERAKIAEAQYSNGLITFNDWIIIEDNLVSEQKAYLNAEAEALLTEAAWVQAKGGTLEAE